MDGANKMEFNQNIYLVINQFKIGEVKWKEGYLYFFLWV